MEEKRVSKDYYKLTLKYLKVIPMLLALCNVLNTILYFFGIDVEVISFIGGISVLTLGFLYLVSYVFRFCIYHRMFLHYILFDNIVGVVEYTIGIPVKVETFIAIWSIYTGIFLFLILYFRKRTLCCT